MRAWAKVDRERYRRIPLRAHTFLAGVPLHDAWQVRLPGGGPAASSCTPATRAMIALVLGPITVNPAVRVLFGLRRWLGRVFGLDREPSHPGAGSFIERLTADDRSRSLVEPGSADA